MFPTIVRCRVRSTHSSTACPSSRTAIRDSCLVALMTISRAMRERHYVIGPKLYSERGRWLRGSEESGPLLTYHPHLRAAIRDRRTADSDQRISDQRIGK